ncbi:MAG: hypothetical protein ACREJX_07060 [Polyangiaceae bacterium]
MRDYSTGEREQNRNNNKANDPEELAVDLLLEPCEGAIKPRKAAVEAVLDTIETLADLFVGSLEASHSGIQGLSSHAGVTSDTLSRVFAV